MEPLRPLLKRVRALIRRIDAAPALPRPTILSPGLVMISHRGFGSLVLDDADAADYRATLNALVEWAAKHRAGAMSGREVAKHLQRAVLEALNEPEGSGQTTLQARTAVAVETLERRLTCQTVEWRAIVVVSGLVVGRPRAFGFVRFRTATPAFIRRLQSSARVLLEQSPTQPEARRSFADYFNRGVNEAFNGRTVALIPVLAVDHDAAWDLARTRLEDALDALNFLANIVERGTSPITAGALGQPVDRHVLINATTVVGPSVSVMHPFALDQLREKGSGRTTARRVSNLLKAEPSQRRERLLSALKWAARADVADRPSDRLLQYCISLETLLLDRSSRGGKGYPLGVRCAHLIAARGWRAEVAEGVRRVYQARNQVVHGGVLAIDEGITARARLYAKHAILRMLGPGPGRLQNDAELSAWFDRRLLGERRRPTEATEAPRGPRVVYTQRPRSGPAASTSSSS